MSDTENITMPTQTNSAINVSEDEYVEEEVEVSEDEVSADDEVAKLPLQSPSVDIKKTSKPASTPKKVKPTEAVKNAPMETPESMKSKSKSALVPGKNPFPSVGTWNSTNLSQINIRFPILTGKNETTNELTRESRPEARYWKAPIAFEYGGFVSESMRFDNVHIPFHTGKGYGENYVYMVLPIDAATAFAAAGKANAPTKVTENSLMEDKARWWKIANKVEGLFGVIINKKFHSKSLATIFDSTQSGISCNVILRFYCKAATDEKEPLRPTTPRSVSIEMVRGYIDTLDVSVQPPTRVSRQRAKVEPTAVSKDIATDSLIERLAALGL